MSEDHNRSGKATARTAGEGRPARLIDVAARAGVSRATAARVLGGYSSSTSNVEDRVRAAAAQLNYRTNTVARAMRAGKTLTIGAVISDISTSFFSSTIRSIMDHASASGYQTLIGNTNEDLATEIEAVRVLQEKRVDGLIVVPSSPTHFDHLLGKVGVPTVLLDRRIDALPLTSVTSDDKASAMRAVDLLLAHGHTRIALLASTSAVRTYSAVDPGPVVSTVGDRIAGAREAMVGAGLDIDRDLLIYCRSDVKHARAATLDILDKVPRPTAILAMNEDMTLGVVAACHARGKSIGRDIP